VALKTQLPGKINWVANVDVLKLELETPRGVE
jgi:hypothetical protein